MEHPPETTSPIYPSRPIRPLPKRRLRSRLSPEIANSILYPIASHVSKPLFYLPFNESTPYPDGSPSGVGDPNFGAEQSQQETRNGNKKNGYQFKGNDVESDDDGVGILRRFQEQRQVISAVSRNVVNGSAPKHAKPQISQSTASSIESVDGYDSFENTNNKKKRKIPTSGTLGSHHATLSAEMAHMGISTSRDVEASHPDPDSGVGQYYGTGNPATLVTSAGTGISGAGRGRFGRVGTRPASGRSPLAVSLNGSNTLQAGRAILQRRDYAPSSSFSGKGSRPSPELIRFMTNSGVDNGSVPDQGIISAAIANAAALPATLPKGQQNISLLEQQSSKKSSSVKTQFTFTCESDTAKGMAWPAQTTPVPAISYQTVTPTASGAQATQNHRGFATQGTQTSPSMAGQPNHTGSQPPVANQQNQQQARKPRRSAGKQYAVAARQRRIRQDYNNYHHPPSSDDVWICEFCEYESIFGSPPEALVRQYEIKDRRERRRLAEKRRLLEKAKMKGRKGKKGNKNAAKTSNATTNSQQSTQKPRHEQKQVDHGAMQHQGTQSEEYLADDYHEDPISIPAPLPRTPSQIPKPVAQNQGQNQRSATGTRTPSLGGTSAG
ncbi:hypothetical protein MMC07_007052 [Pseudocyphellaria aurata]|nr:hypothetical protein [Pseudocyphellaria aurata]